MRLRVMVADKMTAWQRLKEGIVTGCIISVVLFVMGMNLIILRTKKHEDQRHLQGYTCQQTGVS